MREGGKGLATPRIGGIVSISLTGCPKPLVERMM